MNFWNNFKSLCDENNTTPNTICRELKFSNATATHWKNGTIPKGDALLLIAERFGVTTDYLLGKKSEPNVITLPENKIRLIPLFESVSAGFGAYADSHIIEYMPLYIDSDYEAENTLAIKVKGDSMYPKIEDGDIVVVCKDIDYEDGNIVVALVDGTEGFVKRIKTEPNKITLESINPEYAPKIYTDNDTERVKIVGVVRQIVKLL